MTHDDDNNRIMEEAFFFFNHQSISVEWRDQNNPSTLSAIRRICSITPQYFLLMNQNSNLFEASFDHGKMKLEVSFMRNDVIDVSYCREVQALYIVTEDGCVLKQQAVIGGDGDGQGQGIVSNDRWQPVSFDPLEMFEDGVCIRRVCCSSDGALFISAAGDIYALGNCGLHFSVNCDQPKLVRLFKSPLQILDLNAGDHFFVFLTQKEAKSREYGELPDLICSEAKHSSRNDELSSPATQSSISTYTLESNIRSLLREGYTILHTEIYTMGAVNKGLLGSGDHIKRDYIVSVDKLQEIGVCSLSTGRDHTVVRTIDGSLYHWGLNSQQQLTVNSQVYELSSPTEITFDSSDSDVSNMNILEACCGDYRTVLLNTQGHIFSQEKQLIHNEKDFVALQMNFNSKQNYPLLLTSSRLTIYNRRQFKTQFNTLYHHLQLQTKSMMKYRRHLQYFKGTKMIFTDLQRQWDNVLYLTIGILNSLEQFYRGDFDDSSQLIVVKYFRECIKVFEDYSKSYCDIYSIGGFHEAQRTVQLSLSSKAASPTSIPPIFDSSNEDIFKIFQHPFQICPYVTQLLENIEKNDGKCNSELQSWLEFVRHMRIDLELAENTCEFWKVNQKNSKIFNFKQKERRVILSSTVVPIKLSSHSMGLTTPIFILFSDCLCQVVNHVIAFPLDAMWLKKDDSGITIKTPEKMFLLTSKSHLDIDLWYDQLESSIRHILNLSESSKIPEVRSIGYNFSSNHSIYSGVYVQGSFSNGVMHGKCRLEFPGGKVYAGDVIHGVLDGYGRMFLPKSGLYKGYFKNGKFCGYGTLIISEKEIYEGYFRNGLFHGHGYLRHSDYVYVGEFEDNLKCSYGVLEHFSGDKYLGMFSGNKKQGSGIYITASGNYFEGLFTNDELTGKSIAVFPNNFYYEGESSLFGPNGTGKYYMPLGDTINQDNVLTMNGENSIGSILIGQLSGTWEKVRINNGTMEINAAFPKHPNSLGLRALNMEKWSSLFNDFEYELFGDLLNATQNTKAAAITFALWNRVVSFISKQLEIENEMVIPKELDIRTASSSSRINNGKRHFWPLHTTAPDFDKLSLNSSIFGFEKHELNKAHSQSEETLLNGLDFRNFDLLNTFSKLKLPNAEENLNFSALMNVMENCSTAVSMHTFNDSGLSSCAILEETKSFKSEIDVIPSFGLSELNEQDLSAIKSYLRDAFRYRYHPLKHLNDRISFAFYRSYGCWKLKPTPLLAKIAMREWESISQRVYKFIRRLFPSLPEEYAIVGEKREIVSHITLLYPILLSEDIYSTLFVLYADKYSYKDELYRQNVMQAEKLSDEDLVRHLEFDNDLLAAVGTDKFANAVQMLKELKEQYSPMAMLTVIENCMEQLTHAYQEITRDNQTSLNADVIMPLTLVLLMRAGIHHLGAELALLDDLTDSKNFQIEMNGIRGYCYTTLKASYEHLASKLLFDNN